MGCGRDSFPNGIPAGQEFSTWWDSWKSPCSLLVIKVLRNDNVKPRRRSQRTQRVHQKDFKWLIMGGWALVLYWKFNTYEKIRCDRCVKRSVRCG